jgi:hypothetical protein
VTDELRETVVGPAAKDARNPRARRWLALLAVVAAASALAFAGIAAEVFLREADLQTQVTTLAGNAKALADNAKQNNAAAQTLADQVRKLGGTPVVSPPPGPTGAAGPAGPTGTAGRGITGSSISGGHLYLTYSDGVTEDKGQVVGAKGTDGRGISGVNATSGHLVLSYSDGSTSDAGQVVGPQGAVGATGAAGTAGRGVKAVATTGGELVITYDDGSTADAGPLPAGPPGPAGPAGPPGADGKPPAGWTWTDVVGRTYECRRDPSSPDSAPTYTCAAQSPTTTSTPSSLVRVPGN